MKRRFSIALVVAMFQLALVSLTVAAPIHNAATGGNSDELTRLIAEDPANLEVPDQNGLTPLHWAAWYGRTAAVQALLALGADVNARNQTGLTPLHWAASNGHTATVQTLVASGANVEARNHSGFTPLQRAQLHSRAGTVAALQPAAIEQTHTQTADAHSTAGNHALAARSYTWAAQALPGTETARVSHTRAAESHTLHAHAQVAARDFASAVEHYRLSHAAHTAAGNHDSARLSHRLATLLAQAVPAQDHLASAREYAQTMESHFETAVAKVDEMQVHSTPGDEAAALSFEAQVRESLSAADRSEEQTVVAFEAALTALDGAMKAYEEAQVADAPAAHLVQYTAVMDSLRAHMRSISTKIEETRESAAAGHERVARARGRK